MMKNGGLNIVRKWSQHSEEERGSQHSEERGVNIVRKGSQHSEERGVKIVRKNGEST